VVGFLSHTRFIYGADQFSGIKIAFVIPIILIGLYYYVMPHRLSSTFFVLKRFIQSPIQTVGLLAVIVCAASIGVALVRSGNNSHWIILDAEENMRFLLENSFIIRPRTKEFLIGYPFLLISYWYIDRGINKRWAWFFIILGSLGLISVMNSFCHIHSPLLIGLHRVVVGLVAGVIMAFIYLFFIKIGIRFYKKIMRLL
jgi:hypothetical protein